MSTDGPKRLPAAERRRQLVGIGLDLLMERPLADITVEEVSRRAGISRGLLFNYFPTRRDYHLAVIRAAMLRMWRIADATPEVAPEDFLWVVIKRFIAFLERGRDPYVAIRGFAGTDEDVAAIKLESRNRMVQVMLRALGRESRPDVDLLIVGWIAFVEETVLTSIELPVLPRSELAPLFQRLITGLVEPTIVPRERPSAEGVEPFSLPR